MLTQWLVHSQKLEIAANALAEEMAKAWAKLEDGLTVTATAWTRSAVVIMSCLLVCVADTAQYYNPM